jgi:lipopolysaccharide transport system permease protein
MADNIDRAAVDLNARNAPSTPGIIIEADQGFFSLNARDLWEYRELLFFMVWRDLSVRYKQTLLGLTWVILQPLVTLAIFSIIFGILLEVPSGDFPYPVMVFVALVPWRYFASALGTGSDSLVNNAPLISKVFFPRMIIPLASMITPLVEFLISLGLLLLVMIAYGISPLSWKLLALPLLMIITVLTVFSVVLWLSALNVRYRDIKHITPFLTQIWMYLTPVIYPIEVLPQQFRMVYGLNPMVGVIEGFRWVLLGAPNPEFGAMVISTGVVVILFVGGLIFFDRMERTFGDVI